MVHYFFIFLSILSLMPILLNAEDRVPSKIQVGVLLPFGGYFSRYSEQARSTLEKVLSPSFELIYEDEGCDPLKATKAFQRLSTQQGIKLFIGPVCGSPQAVIAPLLIKKNSIAILPSSAPLSVFSDSGKRMFSVQHSIEAESTFNAKKLTEIGIHQVVILISESEFARTHETAFRRMFRSKVAETLILGGEDLSELKTLALRIKQLHPDALYVPDVVPFLRGLMQELRLANIGDLPVYSIYAIQSDDVRRIVGTNGKPLSYSYPDIGEKDALDYFPMLAAEIMSKAIQRCSTSSSDNLVACVHEGLLGDSVLKREGMPHGEFILKKM